MFWVNLAISRNLFNISDSGRLHDSVHCPHFHWTPKCKAFDCDKSNFSQFCLASTLLSYVASCSSICLISPYSSTLQPWSVSATFFGHNPCRNTVLCFSFYYDSIFCVLCRDPGGIGGRWVFLSIFFLKPGTQAQTKRLFHSIRCSKAYSGTTVIERKFSKQMANKCAPICLCLFVFSWRLNVERRVMERGRQSGAPKQQILYSSSKLPGYFWKVGGTRRSSNRFDHFRRKEAGRSATCLSKLQK